MRIRIRPEDSSMCKLCDRVISRFWIFSHYEKEHRFSRDSWLWDANCPVCGADQKTWELALKHVNKMFDDPKHFMFYYFMMEGCTFIDKGFSLTQEEFDACSGHADSET